MYIMYILQKSKMLSGDFSGATILESALKLITKCCFSMVSLREWECKWSDQKGEN